jgi:cellulose synthase/poly-beta-1,6-N-acetylglucosamine synthase-like glycosyltransferase
MLYLLLATASAISVCIAGFVFLYHAVLLLISLFPERIAAAEGNSPLTRFAVVIPAYNEEASIASTLESCTRLIYPNDVYKVYVVADNCTDSTAEVAMAFGAQVLVRRDDQKRGKGFALQYGIGLALNENTDAVVVLDADCSISENALNVADQYLRGGDKVLQYNNVASNPDSSPTGLLLSIANVLENSYFYAPKSRVGLFVQLRGTGMVFAKEVLNRFPWEAFSVVEDAEHSHRLTMAGIRVRFVKEACVASQFPSSNNELVMQRNRWFGGGFRVAASCFPKMLRAGIVNTNILMCDAAISPWIAMRPLVILQLLLSCLLVVTLKLLFPVSSLGGFLGYSMLGIVVGYLIYSFIGFASVGITQHRIGLLMRMPTVLASYLKLAVLAIYRGSPAAWIRSPRDVSSAIKK